MIDIRYLLYAFLCLVSYFMCYFAAKYANEKDKNKKLEKILSDKYTDFELLQYIAKLYNRVNFSKLRPDQVDLWNEFKKKL